MNESAGSKTSARDFVRKHLLEQTKELIGLCRSNEYGSKFRSAQYSFLWNASLADTETLEAAFDLMVEDGACYDMPIDSNAAFGRILIMALTPSNPAKAIEVFDTLIGLYSDPGEADFIKQEILENL